MFQKVSEGQLATKIVPKKVVMKRLLQLQLSNFGLDLNLNLPFFGSEHLKTSHNFASLATQGVAFKVALGIALGSYLARLRHKAKAS